MLSNSISEDERVDAIGSDFGRLLFTWMIPHADMNGRLSANPRGLRGKVVPLLECNENDVASAVYRMFELGLIVLYEADGAAFLEFTGWSDNQTIRKDREKPRYPDRTDVFPAIYQGYRDDSRSNPGARREHSTVIEAKVSQFKAIQENLSPASESAAGTPLKPVAQARRESIDYQQYVDAWNTEASSLPSVRKLNDNRRRGIQRLLKEHGEDALELLRDAARQVSGDAYWVEHQYGFDNLVPTKVLAKAEKLRNARDGNASTGDALADYREVGL